MAHGGSVLPHPPSPHLLPSSFLLLPSLSRAFVSLLSLRPRKYLSLSLSLLFFLPPLFLYIYFSLPPTASPSVLLPFDTFGRRDRCSLVFVSAPSGPSFSLSFCRGQAQDLSPIRLQPFPFSFHPFRPRFVFDNCGGREKWCSLSRFLSDNG